MPGTQKQFIFGMADITWGGEKLPTLGDAAVLKIEPEFIDIESYELGGTYDRIAKSWKVSLEVVFEEETAKVIQMAIPVEELKDNLEAVKGYTDGALGMSLRSKAKELILHPRNMGESKAMDVTIFKAVPTGSYERRYGLEQGKVAVTFTAMLKDGAEAGQPGNYFRVGEEPAA